MIFWINHKIELFCYTRQEETCIMIVSVLSGENSYHDRDFVPATGLIRWQTILMIFWINHKIELFCYTRQEETCIMIVSVLSGENSYHDRDFVPATGLIRWQTILMIFWINHKIELFCYTRQEETCIMIVSVLSGENSYHDRDFVPATGLIRWQTILMIFWINHKIELFCYTRQEETCIMIVSVLSGENSYHDRDFVPATGLIRWQTILMIFWINHKIELFCYTRQEETCIMIVSVLSGENSYHDRDFVPATGLIRWQTILMIFWINHKIELFCYTRQEETCIMIVSVLSGENSYHDRDFVPATGLIRWQTILMIFWINHKIELFCYTRQEETCIMIVSVLSGENSYHDRDFVPATGLIRWQTILMIFWINHKIELFCYTRQEETCIMIVSVLSGENSYHDRDFVPATGLIRWQTILMIFWINHKIELFCYTRQEETCIMIVSVLSGENSYHDRDFVPATGLIRWQTILMIFWINHKIELFCYTRQEETCIMIVSVLSGENSYHDRDFVPATGLIRWGWGWKVIIPSYLRRSFRLELNPIIIR